MFVSGCQLRCPHLGVHSFGLCTAPLFHPVWASQQLPARHWSGSWCGVHSAERPHGRGLAAANSLSCLNAMHVSSRLDLGNRASFHLIGWLPDQRVSSPMTRWFALLGALSFGPHELCKLFRLPESFGSMRTVLFALTAFCCPMLQLALLLASLLLALLHWKACSLVGASAPLEPE